MALTVNDGSTITLSQAVEWTQNYQNSEFYSGTKAVFYGKNKIESICNQSGAVGMRIYFAINDNNEPTVVLVGADADGNNLESGTIVERGTLCPPACGGGGESAL